MATYTKMRDGSWGLRLVGSEVSKAAGATVTATTKAGKAKAETIGRVVWTGRDDKTGQTIAIASIAEHRERASARGSRGCHTDGNCSSMCSPSSCPCGDGSWFRCC